MAHIYRASASNDRSNALSVFLLYLASNFFWSIIFFNLQDHILALLWLVTLWLLILQVIQAFRKINSLSAVPQIPYLLWVTFAVYLDFGVWRLN